MKVIFFVGGRYNVVPFSIHREQSSAALQMSLSALVRKFDLMLFLGKVTRVGRVQFAGLQELTGEKPSTDENC